MIFATFYIFLVFIVLIICIYFDFDILRPWAANQDMELENIQRNCANQVDPDQENFETDTVDIPPPYLHLVDFANCLGQRFSNSDLPPSFETCVFESQPPSYSAV